LSILANNVSNLAIYSGFLKYVPNNAVNATAQNPPNIESCGLIPQLTVKAPAGGKRSPFFKGG
jgi:hypothetical protein